MRRTAVLLGLGLLLPAGSAAQTRATARAAIVPDTLTVGALVHAAVRITVPPGVRIEFPDSLVLPEDAEGAGVPNIRSDTVADGIAVTAAYPLTAWRPGMLQIPPMGVRLITETGVDTLQVAFPDARIVSVLPQDTTGVEPRPVRDVLGPERVWWPFLLGLAMLLALAALAWWLWRRRQRRPGELHAFTPATPPHEVALALLERVRTLRMIENGEIRRAYIVMAEALRGFLEAVDPEWGADLTTTELAALLAVEQVDADPALGVLHRADLVKFAKARVEPEAAHADLRTAGTWVRAFAESRAAEPEPPVLVMEPQ